MGQTKILEIFYLSTQITISIAIKIGSFPSESIHSELFNRCPYFSTDFSVGLRAYPQKMVYDKVKRKENPNSTAKNRGFIIICLKSGYLK